MVTTELGACEWFVWDLRRSNLIDRGQLDQVVGEYLHSHPRAEPPALAEYLVSKGILSQFQAERLLQGKTQGFVLGPFTLMDALGAGSMGTVYKAQSKNDNHWYAVKVLPRRSMWNVRIARRKVRAFEQCRHPAVVPFVDVGTAGGMHYLAWPFVEGETLEKVVTRQSRLTPAVAAMYALQVAEGLDVCHHAGLFHGLLKPSNLLIASDHQVFILDFGIGCLLAETEGESLVDTMSTANSVASGLDCASPESIMDPTNLTPAGDQYSLGCVLYYGLTGQYPFADGSAAEKMMAHQFKEPVPVRELNPEVPKPLADIVERLMKKAPEGRYGNVSEVVEALKPLSAPSPRASRVAPRPPMPAAAMPAPAARPAPPPMPELPRHVPAPAEPQARGAAQQPTGAPRPQGMPSLPSRQTLRGSPPPPAPVPVRVVPKAQAPAPQGPAAAQHGDQEREVPGYVPDGAPTWDEKIGPLGITLIAILACGAAWLLTAMLL